MDMGPIREEREALRGEVEALRAELARYKAVAHEIEARGILAGEVQKRVVMTCDRHGVWASHGSDEWWVVDHLPTGSMVWEGPAEIGVKLLRRLGDELPDFASDVRTSVGMVVPDDVSKKIHSLIREVSRG